MKIIEPHQLVDAELMFKSLEEARYTVSAGTVIYKGKINEKLQERRPEAYEEVLRLIEEESCRNLCGYDYELYCFYNTGSIYRAEREAGLERTVYDTIEYVDDFEEIYVRLRQFFRRIQIGCGEASMPMFQSFVREKGLSVQLIAVLLGNIQVGNKDRIAGFLAEYYRKQGREEDAETLQKIFTEQLSEEADGKAITYPEGMQE